MFSAFPSQKLHCISHRAIAWRTPLCQSRTTGDGWQWPRPAVHCRHCPYSGFVFGGWPVGKNTNPEIVSSKHWVENRVSTLIVTFLLKSHPCDASEWHVAFFELQTEQCHSLALHRTSVKSVEINRWKRYWFPCWSWKPINCNKLSSTFLQ